MSQGGPARRCLANFPASLSSESRNYQTESIEWLSPSFETEFNFAFSGIHSRVL